MKCYKAELALLLQDSGELSVRKSDALAEHLDQCASCRNFRLSLMKAGNLYSPDDEPSLKTTQNIVREIRVNAPNRKQVRVFGLKPVVGMASLASLSNSGVSFSLEP